MFKMKALTLIILLLYMDNIVTKGYHKPKSDPGFIHNDPTMIPLISENFDTTIMKYQHLCVFVHERENIFSKSLVID